MLLSVVLKTRSFVERKWRGPKISHKVAVAILTKVRQINRERAGAASDNAKGPNVSSLGASITGYRARERLQFTEPTVDGVTCLCGGRVKHSFYREEGHGNHDMATSVWYSDTQRP